MDDVVLQDWAQIEGTLYHGGRPMPMGRISWRSIRPQFADHPHVWNSHGMRADEHGRFVINHVPPVKSTLRTVIARGIEHDDDWQSVPLDPAPGQRIQVNIGAGARVTARAALTGDVPPDVNLQISSVYMIRRDSGIELPVELANLDLDLPSGWDDALRYTPEGRAYLETLHHYSIETNADGTFLIDGVPAGAYDLALRFYGPPRGGIVLNPIAKRVVRFRVSEADVERGSRDLGSIEIEASIGTPVGANVPDFRFEALDRGAERVSDLRGRYVLLHFWCSQWETCREALPSLERLYEAYRADDRLAVLSLSFDPDQEMLRRVITEQELPWRHGWLGDRFKSDVPARLGVNSVPAYFLIDPGGKLVHKGHSPDEVREHLDTALRQRNR